jgi:hypothetical protein
MATTCPRPAFNNMAPSFAYQPLTADRCIRLVHLSADTAVGHGFKITLREASLDDDVEFRALSYTWGLPFHTDIYDLKKPNIDIGNAFDLLVDGQSFTVTENLFYALKQLGGNGEKGPVWVDALSINQQDDKEKLAQVNMMSDIYSSASQVIVWLGRDDPSAQFIAMHHNEALEAYMTKVALGEGEPIPTEDELQTMGMHTLLDWQEMWWVYVSWYRQQKYFRRVWIIQETALARDIIVRCGTCALDWTRLVVIGNLLLSSGINTQWTLLGTRTERLAEGREWTPGNEIRMLHMFRTDHRLNGGLPMHLHKTKANFMRGRQDGEMVDTVTESLLRGLGALGNPHHKEYAYLTMVLRQFAEYQATEMKDHVFAALSFCAPFFRKAGMAVPPISVSYEQSVEEVFTEVAAKLLTSLPVLSALSVVDMEDKRNPRLPSWVSNFASPYAPSPLIQRGFMFPGGKEDEGEAGQPIYNATNHTWPPPPGEEAEPLATYVTGGQLIVTGTQLDHVKAVCSDSSSSAIMFQFLPYLEFAAENLPSLYPPTGQYKDEVLWRTMCGNYSKSDREYPASHFVGAQWFRQYILENMAIRMMSEVGTDDSFSNAARAGVVLTALNMEGSGCHFLPGFLELVGLFQTYAVELVATMQNMPGGVEGALEDDSQEALKTAACARLGSSEAEREVISMVMMSMALPLRRMFVTEGGMLGVAPPGVQQGDEVWLLRGARVPFILRRKEVGSENDLTLVGEAYLHGAMNGEMVDPELGVGATTISLS